MKTDKLPVLVEAAERHPDWVVRLYRPLERRRERSRWDDSVVVMMSPEQLEQAQDIISAYNRLQATLIALRENPVEPQELK